MSLDTHRYDIAFVLAHNEAGGPQQAAEAVIACFGGERATLRSAMDDLLANFAEPNAQGPCAYAEQMRVDHPEMDNTVLRADAVVSVRTFHTVLYSSQVDF